MINNLYQMPGSNMQGMQPPPMTPGFQMETEGMAGTNPGAQGFWGALGGMFGGGGGNSAGYMGGGYPPTPPMSGTPPQQPPSGGFSSPAVGQPGWMDGHLSGIPPGGMPPMGNLGGAPFPGTQQGSPPPTNGGWGSYSQQPYQQNPYLQQQLSGLQRSFNNNLTRNVLPAIQSGASAVGGIGGSREGIAQGLAVGDSQAGLANAMSNLSSNAYESDMNRALQGYGIDQQTGLGYTQAGNQFALGQGGLANQRYGMDQNYNLGQQGIGLGYFNGQNSYNLGQGQNANQRYGIDQATNLGYFNGGNSFMLGMGGLQNQANIGDQNFYTQQRGQDLQSMQLGASLYGLGNQGQWQGLQNASGIYSPYTGYGQNTQTQQGGGWPGAAGGALGGFQLGNLWGGSSPTDPGGQVGSWGPWG